MEVSSEFKGLDGNIVAFKEEVANAGKVTFVGLPGVCTPFAELFPTPSGRRNLYFYTRTDLETARKIIFSPNGMQLGEQADPTADVLAILGGLSMPKAQVKFDEVRKLRELVIQGEGKFMGLCYWTCFVRQGGTVNWISTAL
jgi:hypothetical protein